MVRVADTAKETSLEALWILMQRKNMSQRPRLKQVTYGLVVYVVECWKGKGYWKSDEIRDKPLVRDKLLVAVTAWLKRRKKRGTPHPQVHEDTLRTYLEVMEN